MKRTLKTLIIVILCLIVIINIRKIKGEGELNTEKKRSIDGLGLKQEEPSRIQEIKENIKKEEKENNKTHNVISIKDKLKEFRKQQKRRLESIRRKIKGKKTLIIAHRGASGKRPEHTLEAYARAIEEGADYIEQDVVMSKDGEILVCHDRELSGFTDIEDQRAEFGERVTKLKQDHEKGKPKYYTDWFAEDYPFEKLKKLNIRQRYEFRGKGFDGLYRIYKMKEVLEWVEATNKNIGLYIELKNPHYLNTIGLNIQQKLLDLLSTYGYLEETKDGIYKMKENKKVIIQCFEATTLKWFKERTIGVPLIQLIYSNVKKMQPDNPKNTTYEVMLTDEGLKDVASYAHGIGPHKIQVVKQDAESGDIEETDLIERAHKLNLAVHPYTFRADEYFLMKGKTYEDEINMFMDLDVDGFFTDFPGETKQIVNAYEGYNDSKMEQWQTIILTIVSSTEIGLTFIFIAIAAGIHHYTSKKRANQKDDEPKMPFVLPEPSLDTLPAA